jgi:7-carboxy-7-deazaguanine synthase
MMFGENVIRHAEKRADGKLQVSNIFFTLQGEGPYAGWPAVFVRLTGCNLACLFCDTQWEDKTDKYLSPEEVVEEINQYPQRKLIVITGGEPLRQDISGLLRCLFRQEESLIQFETAGTLWQDCLLNSRVRIVVSPKTPIINKFIYANAHAFKYVIKARETSEIDGLPIMSTQIPGKPAMIARPRPGATVYLSPCDEMDSWINEKNRDEVVRLSMKHGYVAGIQMHKIWNVE